MSSLVGNKGQITIEKEIRDALGVQPGWRAVQRLVNGRVELQFLPPRHRRSLRGILGNPHGVRLESDEEFQAAVARAWDGAASEAAVLDADVEREAHARKASGADD